VCINSAERTNDCYYNVAAQDGVSGYILDKDNSEIRLIAPTEYVFGLRRPSFTYELSDYPNLKTFIDGNISSIEYSQISFTAEDHNIDDGKEYTENVEAYCKSIGDTVPSRDEITSFMQSLNFKALSTERLVFLAEQYGWSFHNQRLWSSNSVLGEPYLSWYTVDFESTYIDFYINRGHATGLVDCYNTAK
jgi:hypothetical protein